MDPELEQRIAFFRDAGQADDDVCAFVAAELRTLSDAGYVVTEDTAGMFATHLLTALQRVRRGAPLEDPPAAGLIAAELAGRADAVTLARALAARADATAGVCLPAGEADYVALHIATLPQRAPAGPALDEPASGSALPGVRPCPSPHENRLTSYLPEPAILFDGGHRCRARGGPARPGRRPSS